MNGAPSSDRQPQSFAYTPEQLEDLVEARAAEKAHADALYWRIRLVCIETLLLGTLVLVAGLIIGEPVKMVLRAAIIIAAGCLASGMLLIGLSDAANAAWKRLKQLARRP
tara:strand:+ start:3794 stop:4123 length:330 start_codon:yes stop_codon:yes gene_type:complete